jgi:L-arabonate dehydrase
MSRSPGSCNTMGTASTMASMAEALGMALSGNAAIPAVDSRRRVMAQLSGRRIVQMVKDDLKPSDILTRKRRSRTRSAPTAPSAARPMR